jgi:large subunit ribosomal protein L33
MRDSITMSCSECKRKNYMTTRNKKKTTEKLELKKYCSFCRTHTIHKESK